MVYRGPPSKGCFECRKRKIRCDQGQPRCFNCLKSNRKCPGYRNQLNLIFHDETNDVTRKVKLLEIEDVRQDSASIFSNSNTGPYTTSEEDLNHTFNLLRHNMPGSTLLASCRVFIPTIDERAMRFFFANYVIEVGSSSLLLPGSEGFSMKSNLLASMKAVGLAGFAKSVHAPELIQEAKKRYSEALHLTNNALGSPVDVKKDSALLGIMVLSIFETISGDSRLSLTAWKNHLNGAAALLKLRGREQLKTPKGRWMFIQITTSLIHSLYPILH